VPRVVCIVHSSGIVAGNYLLTRTHSWRIREVARDLAIVFLIHPTCGAFRNVGMPIAAASKKALP
jgi:hypothetical protein